MVFAVAGMAAFFFPWVEIMDEIGTGFQIAKFDRPGEWTLYSLVWLSPVSFFLIFIAGKLRLPVVQLVISVGAGAGPVIALKWAERSFPEHWKYVVIQNGTSLVVGCGVLCAVCAFIQVLCRPARISDPNLL